MTSGPYNRVYPDKTIEPTSYGMSFNYDTIKSKYHIDLNNPKVAYDDDWAMTMYGEFRAHASDSHRRLNSQGIALK